MLVRVKNLAKSFQGTRAVDGVSFEISEFGICGLIGPNGAGKTTTLRMLTSYLTPTAGTVCIAGFDSVRQPLPLRGRIGYLPEGSALPQDARVDEYLAFRAGLKGVERRRRTAELDRCLQICGLTGQRRRILGRLSHGQQRRAALADALLNDPPVLILDEPTIGLDPLQVLHLRGFLSEVASTHCVLISTHVLSEAEAVCDRVLIMNGGRLADDIDLREDGARQACFVEVDGVLEELTAVFTGIATGVDVKWLSSAGCWHRLELSAASVEDLRSEVAATCLRQGWKVRELTASPRSLETRFVRAVLPDSRKAA